MEQRRRLAAIARHLAVHGASPIGAAESSPWVFSGFADEAGSSIEEQIEAHKAAGMTHIDLRNVIGRFKPPKEINETIVKCEPENVREEPVAR